MARKVKYQTDWFTEDLVDGVDALLPGIYEWTIEGAGVYIGKYSHRSRPRREYAKNVHRLLNGLPYRPNNPAGFRAIHRALAAAVREGRKVTLRLIENCADTVVLNLRERELIAERRESSVKTGLQVFNA